jgi:ribonucleotide reductase alpha subunit
MDWVSLKERVKRGMRNSLLTAVMPTASTAQIMGNYECVEPPTNNIFMRRTLAGQFTVVNRYLQRDLAKLGLWTTKMKDTIVGSDGSIAAISVIPQGLRDLYKTVWEIPQKALIDMSIDRAPFVDQSQSLNLFMAIPDYNKLFSMHMYGWKNGLKTGMYYLRTRPAANPIKYGTDQSEQEGGPTTSNACSRENREECTSCSA